MNTVIFLPGILLGRDCFIPIEKLFQASGFNTYIHSFPGYDGEARLPQETPSPEDYADDLYEKIKLLGKVHIFAHCSGCSPALALALKYPDIISSITLVSYWHGTKEWESRKAVLIEGVELYTRNRVPALISSTDKEVVERVVKWLCAGLKDVEGFFQMARSIAKFHVKETLNLVDVPLQFIVGGGDRVTSPEAQSSVAKNKCARLSIIPEGSHCMFFEDPLPSAEAALSFIRSLSIHPFANANKG